MTEEIAGQLRFLLVTACAGIALILCYDIWRLLRWLIPHSKRVVWTEDLIYWTLVSVPLYAVFFYYNDGKIRWYGVCAVLCGALLYEKGISGVVRAFGRKHLEKPKKRLARFLAKRFRKLFSFRRLKKICQKFFKKKEKPLQSLEK